MGIYEHDAYKEAKESGEIIAVDKFAYETSDDYEQLFQIALSNIIVCIFPYKNSDRTALGVVQISKGYMMENGVIYDSDRWQMSISADGQGAVVSHNEDDIKADPEILKRSFIKICKKMKVRFLVPQSDYLNAHSYFEEYYKDNLK